MKILLLGATGLVGKNVLAQALAHPASQAWSRPPANRWHPIQSSIILSPIAWSRCSA